MPTLAKQSEDKFFIDKLGPSGRKIVVSILLLIALGSIWGSVPNLGKYVGQAGMLPLVYAVYTVSIGAMLLSILNLIRRVKLPISKRHLIFYAVSGIISTGLPLVVMFHVVNHIPAGIMSILMACIPLLAYAIVIAIRQETFNASRLMGLVIGFVGVCVILISQTGLASGVSPLWVALGFVTPLCYAAGNVYNFKCRPADTDALVAANCMMICAAVFLLIAVLVLGQLESLFHYSTLVVSVTVLHGLLSGIGFTVFFGLLKIAGPVYVSQVAYLVALTGIALGMVMFGERFDLWFWLAVALICVGIGLVNRTNKQVKAAN